MLSFKRYLSEEGQAVNKHATHIEDLILLDWPRGFRRVVNHVDEVVAALSSHAKTRRNITVKWDGCVHEDTIVLTDQGEMRVGDLVRTQSATYVMGRDLTGSLTHDKLTQVHHSWSSRGHKSWVEITLENGSTLKLTEDHEVHTTNRGWVAAGLLTEEDDVSEL